MKTNTENIEILSRIYFIAKKYVIKKGYSHEIDWQDEVNFSSVTYQTFLKEYSWVVLASGLSDKVVSKIFPKIEKIMINWERLDYIAQNVIKLENSLLKIFNNKLKIKALLETSIMIYEKGFQNFKNEIQSQGLSFLKTLSFIGETTCFHIAKNIGLPFAKPDRHLLRISNKIGYSTPNELCKNIAEHIAEKIQVVDLVIWRYATLDPKYEQKLIGIRRLL